MKGTELTQHILVVSWRMLRCLAPLFARISADGTMSYEIWRTTLVLFSVICVEFVSDTRELLERLRLSDRLLACVCLTSFLKRSMVDSCSSVL